MCNPCQVSRTSVQRVPFDTLISYHIIGDSQLSLLIGVRKPHDIRFLFDFSFIFCTFLQFSFRHTHTLRHTRRHTLCSRHNLNVRLSSRQLIVILVERSLNQSMVLRYIHKYIYTNTYVYSYSIPCYKLILLEAQRFLKKIALAMVTNPFQILRIPLGNNQYASNTFNISIKNIRHYKRSACLISKEPEAARGLKIWSSSTTYYRS